MKYALTGTHRSPLIWHVLRDEPVWLSLCYNGVQRNTTRNDVPADQRLCKRCRRILDAQGRRAAARLAASRR